MKFTQPNDDDYSLQLTPLVDVVFLLLIFFMVSTSFIDFSKKIEIELPESKSGDPLEKIKLYELEVTLDKKLFLNGEPVTVETLPSALKETRVDLKKSGIIRADKKLDYGYLVTLIGIYKESGFVDVGLAVK